MQDRFSELAGKVINLITEERVVRETPFTPDELKVLINLYDFRKFKDSLSHLQRSPAPGELEDIIKYNDNTYTCLVDDSRQKVKYEFASFHEMAHKLSKTYKVSNLVGDEQELPAPDKKITIEAP